MMKTKIKKVLALLTLSLGILAVAPSDAKAETAVVGTIIVNGVDTPNTVECQKFVPRYYEVGADGTLRSRSELYATRQDMVKTIFSSSSGFDTEEMISNQDDASLMNQFLSLTSLDFSGFKFVGIENLNGVQVYHFSKNLDVSASQFKPEEMTAHTFKISEMNASWLANVTKGKTVRFKMPFKVAKTNGVLLDDGQTVEFTSTLDDETNTKFTKIYFWAIDSTQKNIVIDNVKPKVVIKKNLVSVEDFYISKVYIDGKLETSINKVVNYDEMDFERKFKKGNHYVIVIDLYGNSTIKTFKVSSSGKITSIKTVKDKTKPTTNMKAKTYKTSVKITFEDKYGIQKATLNGKKIKNNYKVKKNGTYTLKVYDLLNNCKTVKFKIKK